jgi:N-acetylglutamate synthase-like GNAT family acetyltransferase
MNTAITAATVDDIKEIARIIRANRDDPSLFQQSPRQIADAIDEFLVARVGGEIAGCVAVHDHGGSYEILAVAVAPGAQGQGVGGALVAAAIGRAASAAPPLVWLGTAKPGYFARHGFAPMSRWRLPIRLLLRKLWSVFGQPIGRWIPAIFGRHVFMALSR